MGNRTLSGSKDGENGAARGLVTLTSGLWAGFCDLVAVGVSLVGEGLGGSSAVLESSSVGGLRVEVFLGTGAPGIFMRRSERDLGVFFKSPTNGLSLVEAAAAVEVRLGEAKMVDEGLSVPVELVMDFFGDLTFLLKYVQKFEYIGQYLRSSRNSYFGRL